MTKFSKYLKNSKLSTFKIKKIIEHFCLDINASKAAPLVGVNRNTINYWYNRFRVAIYAHQHKEFEKIFGEAEVDESYFGARRKRGLHGKLKRGRGTQKQPVFGILKRNGHVYTEIVPNCKKDILQSIIRGKVDKSAVIYSDSWRSYDGLVDVGYDKHSGLITETMNLQGKVQVFTSTALKILELHQTSTG